jgi:phosphoglycerate dehydrogenase-like enzyme
VPSVESGPGLGARVVVCVPARAEVVEAMCRRLAESGCEWAVVAPGRADVELLAALEGAQALIVGPTPVTAELLRAAPSLSVVSRFGIGVDNIDLEAAARAGVRVTMTAGSNAESVADLAMGLIIALERQLPAMTAEVRSGGFTRVFGHELRGQTLGLLGYGATACALAHRASVFGMHVMATARRPLTPEPGDVPVQRVDLGEMLERSDVVSLHIPLAAETRHVIGAAELARMRPEAYLVNTARGGLIDEAALLEALRERRLAGAALDVFEIEPPTDQSLLQHERLIATPHLGGATVEAFARTGLVAADNVVAVLRGLSPRGLVTSSIR